MQQKMVVRTEIQINSEIFPMSAWLIVYLVNTKTSTKNKIRNQVACIVLFKDICFTPFIWRRIVCIKGS